MRKLTPLALVSLLSLSVPPEGQTFEHRSGILRIASEKRGEAPTLVIDVTRLSDLINSYIDAGAASTPTQSTLGYKSQSSGKEPHAR